MGAWGCFNGVIKDDSISLSATIYYTDIMQASWNGNYKKHYIENHIASL